MGPHGWVVCNSINQSVTGLSSCGLFEVGLMSEKKSDKMINLSLSLKRWFQRSCGEISLADIWLRRNDPLSLEVSGTSDPFLLLHVCSLESQPWHSGTKSWSKNRLSEFLRIASLACVPLRKRYTGGWWRFATEVKPHEDKISVSQTSTGRPFLCTGCVWLRCVVLNWYSTKRTEQNEEPEEEIIIPQRTRPKPEKTCDIATLYQSLRAPVLHVSRLNLTKNVSANTGKIIPEGAFASLPFQSASTYRETNKKILCCGSVHKLALPSVSAPRATPSFLFSQLFFSLFTMRKFL